MEFYEVLAARRSIRAYTDLQIPEDVISRLAHAAYLAPSACNRQPYRFLIVTGEETRDKICAVAPQAFLREAPVIIVAVAETLRSWQRPGDDHTLAELDMGIAMEHIVLAAAAERLGTCWVAAYNVAKMNAALGLAEGENAVAISPLGYPAEEPRLFQRNKSERDLFTEITE